MKAITLTQPWATLVSIGAKRIETRSWRTSFRGPVAIHAAKGFPKYAREICDDPRFALEIGPAPLPLGMVVGMARLVSCLPTSELQSDQLIQMDGSANCSDFLLDERERAFGDYSVGRWAWLLADIKQCDPIPAKGALGLWEWRQ